MKKDKKSQNCIGFSINSQINKGVFHVKQKLAKLIDVKSLVTLALTGLFCALAFKGNIPKEVNNIYLMIIAFYFGTQHAKKNKGDE